MIAPPTARGDAFLPAARCLFCGEMAVLEIADIWTDSDFLLETCCPAYLEQVTADMEDDPAWGRNLLRRLGAEVLTGHRLRRVNDGKGCHPMLDWQLEIRPVSFRAARTFVLQHHAHCLPPVGWRFGISVWNGYQMIGVATVGNPVARAFGGRGIIEVNRLCVRRDTPALLRWNAASMLYGQCARLAERSGWQRIITYTRADEDGVSLRAAGWTEEGPAGGGGWHNPARPRANRNAFIGKIRWTRLLRPPAKPPVSRPRVTSTVPLHIGDRTSSVCSF